MTIKEGRAIEKGDEAIVDAAWPQENGVTLGATIQIFERPFRVVGIYAPPGGGRIKIPLTTMQDQVGSENRANTILVLLLALLAACELDRLRRGGSSARTRAACAIALAALALVAFEFARAPGRAPLTAWRAVSFALPALLLAGAIALLSLSPGPRRARALAVLLVAGTAVDLLRIGARFNPGTRAVEDYPLSEGVRALRAASAGGRFAAADGVLTGMASAYVLQDVRILNPAAPADYQDALAAAAGYTGPVQNTPRVARLDAPILDFLNVRAHAGWHADPVHRPDRRDAGEVDL